MTFKKSIGLVSLLTFLGCSGNIISNNNRSHVPPEEIVLDEIKDLELNDPCFLQVPLKELADEKRIELIVKLDKKLPTISSTYICSDIDKFVLSESRVDVEVLTQFVDIIGAKWDWADSKIYQTLAKKVTSSELDKLTSLSSDLGDNFDPRYLKPYIKLLDRNVPNLIIGQMNPVYLNEAVNLIDEIQINPELFPDITLNRFEYSKNAAEISPFPKFPLNTKLPKDAHLSLLISGYDAYFQNKDNRREITQLLEMDEAYVLGEIGGNVVSRKDGFKFIPIPDDRIGKITLTEEDDTSYTLPTFAYDSLGSVGLFHFHASPRDDSRMSGPSGADLGSLKFRIPTNPYIVDCVITKLDNSFVATVYFHETYDCESSYGVCSFYAPTTLTLGAYKFVK